jgi:hypothetical protein
MMEVSHYFGDAPPSTFIMRMKITRRLNDTMRFVLRPSRVLTGGFLPQLKVALTRRYAKHIYSLKNHRQTKRECILSSGLT